MIRLNKPNTKHLYEIGTWINGRRARIEVEANTRTQAAAIAKREGYQVDDVNTVG
jgi:hypothetical protein